MAINKIITLTEEGLNAGPYYEAYYSTDCTNYTLATASLYLPQVGSTGSISVADNTLCIKLINLSPNCGENEVIYDFRNTTTTTIAPPPPFTTTTIAPTPTTAGPTTTTTAGPLPTTTTYGPAVKVVAHSCQNFYDFNTYRVPASPSPQIGGVYKDAYGTCYYITSIPTNQGVPGVGDLTYVGTEGACSSSACVTTTTTAAPYCNQWQVSNNTGAGYYFKYYYCGQTEATYLEVPAGQNVTVCTQNDRIYNSFNAPLTFTNLATSCIGTTTTTTLPPDLWRVVAHSCQNYYDFNTYGVNKNLTTTVHIGDVFKDSYGTCYTVSSIPSDQTLPVVGILSYVGGQGACTSSACVTTTTTQAPFCNTWKVENTAGFGQYFKYKYCGQTSFLYPEVAANSSVTVCVQNNQIFNSFNTTLVFTNLSTVCNATTTTTTTQGPKVKFTAASCQDITDFHVYQAASASYNLGDVFKDAYGTCYQILSFNGQVPVGELTYVGPAGNCSSSSCVTTTTTSAPFCNLWQVENPFGSAYSFKYKYCGMDDFIYPSVAPFTSASFCVQNNEIYNAFGAPLIFTNLSGSCQATTTTTTTTAAPTTTTTTTRAPYCATFIADNQFGAGYNISYVYCGQTSAQYVEIPPYSSASFCVQNAQISNLGNPIAIYETTGSCNATTTTTSTTSTTSTTTTTTRAPYCSVWNVENMFGAAYTIQYTYCSESVSTYIQIPAYTTRQLCVQSGKINTLGAPILITETSASCAGGITTTTTAGPTTTTTSTTTSTTTTLSPIDNQKVVMESCDGPGTITTPITLAVNALPLQNGEVVKILGGFGGYDCFTITNNNYGGTTVYYGEVEARFIDCESCQTPTTTTAAPTTTTTIAPVNTFGTTYVLQYPISSSQYTSDTAYFADCENYLTSSTVYPGTSKYFCSIWSLVQVQEWNPNADITLAGFPSYCCSNVTTTTQAPSGICYVSASISVTDSTYWSGNAFFTIDNCTNGSKDLYHINTVSGSGSFNLYECYISGTLNGAYGSVVTFISTGSQCQVWPNTTTTTTTTTTTLAPLPFKTANLHLWSGTSVPKSFSYQLYGATYSGSITVANVHSDYCMDISSSTNIVNYANNGIFNSSMPYFCNLKDGKAYNIHLTNTYPFNNSYATMYFSYINTSGSLVNDTLTYGQSKTIISQVAGFGQQRYIAYGYEGMVWTIGDEHTGSVTPYPYKNTLATYKATLKKGNINTNAGTGSISYVYESGSIGGRISAYNGRVDILTSSVLATNVPMYWNEDYGYLWNIWWSVTPISTTTTTTAGPTTTTTSTTTTTTTAAPTTTTTSTTTTTTTSTTTTTTTSTTTTTTAAPTTTTTASPSGLAYYTVIQAGNSGTSTYSYRNINNVLVSGSLAAYDNILVGARPGTADVTGTDATIRYSSIDFVTQSFSCSACNTMTVTNSSTVSNRDAVLFFVACGTNTLTSSFFDSPVQAGSPYPSSGSVCGCTSVYEFSTDTGFGGTASLNIGGTCS